MLWVFTQSSVCFFSQASNKPSYKQPLYSTHSSLPGSG